MNPTLANINCLTQLESRELNSGEIQEAVKDLKERLFLGLLKKENKMLSNFEKMNELSQELIGLRDMRIEKLQARIKFLKQRL